MKKFTIILTLLSFLTLNGVFAQDQVYYTDEDTDLFNRGKFVGEENKDYIRQIEIQKKKNWSLAIGSTAVGILACILVAKNK